MKPLDIVAAVAVPIIWGMGIVVAKPAVDQFPPILLMAMRFSVSALILVWFVSIPRGLLKALFWVALVGSALQYGLTFNGLRYLDAGTMALIVQAEVPFCTLIAAVWLKERLRARHVVGMLVAFAGIYIVLGEPRIEGKLVGVGLVLAGAFMWALGQVMLRRLGEIGGITGIAWVSVFAAPQLYVSSLVFEQDHLVQLTNAGPTVWIAVAYLGIVMTAVGYGCWYHVLGRYPVYRVAPYLLLVPVASVLGGTLLLDEPLTPHVLLGGAVVILGVAMIVLERRRVP